MSDNEQRFQRLEDKVDRVENKVTSIDTKLDNHMDVMKDHIAGDKKIITEWRPVVEMVPELKDIINEHKFQKKLSEKRTNRLITVSFVVGIFAGIAKILGSF